MELPHVGALAKLEERRECRMVRLFRRNVHETRLNEGESAPRVCLRPHLAGQTTSQQGAVGEGGREQMGLERGVPA